MLATTMQRHTLRFALSLALVLGLSVPAWAQFTLIGQDVVNCGAAESCTIDNAVTAASGDLVVLLVARRTACTTLNFDTLSISDATNGAYTINSSARICDHDNTGVGSVVGYFINSGAAALAPTADWTGGGSSAAYMNFSVWRPTGTVTADQFNEAENAATTSHSHGSITTTGAGLIVTTAVFSAGGITPTANASFTALSNNLGTGGRDFHQYWITTGAETTTGTFATGSSTTTTAAIASFLDSGASGAVPRRLTLLGVGQ